MQHDPDTTLRARHNGTTRMAQNTHKAGDGHGANHAQSKPNKTQNRQEQAKASKNKARASNRQPTTSG